LVRFSKSFPIHYSRTTKLFYCHSHLTILCASFMLFIIGNQKLWHWVSSNCNMLDQGLQK